MQNRVLSSMALLAWSVIQIGVCQGADQFGLSKGPLQLGAVGPMAFGPEGILFLTDNSSGSIVAIGTGDRTGNPADVDIEIPGINVKIAEQLGCNSRQVKIVDLAVNPLSGNVYLNVMAEGSPALIKIDRKGGLSPLDFSQIPHAKAVLPNSPAAATVKPRKQRRNQRSVAVTDLAYVDGQLIVSGLRRGAAPSSVYVVPFPFSKLNPATSLEIYHGAHGRFEDNAAMRTFVPFMINGEPYVLAAYVCTPLVKFPLSDLRSGEKVRGTTVAELGNRNRPLDMISYRKGGIDFLLLANSARGVMKIGTDQLAAKKGITERVPGGGTAGQPYETIPSLAGTVQLAQLNETHAIVIMQKESGEMDLRTVELP